MKSAALFGFLLISSISCQFENRVQLPPGDRDDGGLTLPDDFEAVVVADSVGPARHLVVNENGDIYVKLKRAYETGGIAAFRDTTGDGKADIIKTFSLDQTRGNYETGMEIHDGYLYYSTHLYVFRYPLIPGELIPDTTRRDTIVIDDHDPGHHEHIGKPLSFDGEGNLYTAYGAPSDACQEQNRIPGSPGQDPCPILEDHAGIWKFQSNQFNQVQQKSSNAENNSVLNPTGKRYASGLRSIVAMDWNPVDNELYVVQHGRDNLHSMWPQLFTAWDNAVLPAEEFARVADGSNFGWPYCFYDQFQEKKVLAPEYGGDGKVIGRCSEFDDPLVGFPGHFAPNDLKFYQADQFPEYYRNGAFIAFHGSTIRNPYPQAGYFVGFVPYKDGEFSQDWDVFANGFTEVDPVVNTNDSNYRPMGLAVGPDGSLYISDSVKGKIWRVMYKGDRESLWRGTTGQNERSKTNSQQYSIP
ncbi:MAG: PQQ-dependent sugar dehydrogenase [Balneolaceae bacterium]|nr:PQQ-dependent sugar dehydrogenase [Balneolaceae bacterium]